MKNIAKQPWHVYEGGNFTCVVAPGYEEWMETHHNIAGPFRVCELSPTGVGNIFKRTMKECQKLAAQICDEHNYALRRAEEIDKHLAHLVRVSKKFDKLPISFAT